MDMVVFSFTRALSGHGPPVPVIWPFLASKTCLLVPTLRQLIYRQKDYLYTHKNFQQNAMFELHAKMKKKCYTRA